MAEENKKGELDWDYDKIMSDRKLFNEVVYTPLSEAIKILEERQKDKKLMAKVEELLNGDIPEVLKNKKCGVLSRQVATFNFESKRFISLSVENNLKPIFFEYHRDKFAPENEFKYSLGKINIHNGFGKKGGKKNEQKTIINFNDYNGKKIIDIHTKWGEPLINFHNKLFSEYKSIFDVQFFEGSDWYKRNGLSPLEYYKKFILFFVLNGILFENFFPKGVESNFTKEIILPAIEYVFSTTGFKPLIVPIEPIDIEMDEYWYYYSNSVKDIINKFNL